jgi:phosphotransacetylase
MATRSGLPRVRCAVVHPCDPGKVEGAHLPAQAGLIDPVLVGPRAKIEVALAAVGVKPEAMPIVATEHSHAAAARAVAMARADKGGIARNKPTASASYALPSAVGATRNRLQDARNLKKFAAWVEESFK